MTFQSKGIKTIEYVCMYMQRNLRTPRRKALFFSMNFVMNAKKKSWEWVREGDNYAFTTIQFLDDFFLGNKFTQAIRENAFRAYFLVTMLATVNLLHVYGYSEKKNIRSLYEWIFSFISSCKCNSRFSFCYPKYSIAAHSWMHHKCVAARSIFFCIIWALWERSLNFFCCAAQFLLHSYFYYWILCCCARERCKVWCMRMKGSMCLFIKHSQKNN